MLILFAALCCVLFLLSTNGERNVLSDNKQEMMILLKEDCVITRNQKCVYKNGNKFTILHFDDKSNGLGDEEFNLLEAAVDRFVEIAGGEKKKS